MPLLVTKLNIPPKRASWVTRQRLLLRLDEGLGCKLTLLSAPAGFGKTSLISDWADTLKPTARLARLSLDEGDNWA